MKLVRFILFLSFTGCPTVIHAQDTEAAKILGLTKESGSLPIWSKPSVESTESLGKVARSQSEGVFLVGAPKVALGTAWVVSKKNRLLVTNAHVADIQHFDKAKRMLAIPNGTSNVYTVEKVWYHPGVRRYLNNNRKYSIKSIDPNDGEIDPASPDVAVLQLSPAGPDLKTEFSVASTEDLKSLFAQPAGLMGFPGYNTSWPALGDSAAATFHVGVISRISDFFMNASVPFAELQCVQHTMSSWGGFSGSPIIMSNGKVAAIHNMARSAKNVNNEVRSIPHGVRIDCLFELLVLNGIEDKVPFNIDKRMLSLARWTKPDDASEKILANHASAKHLVSDAMSDIDNEKYYDAITKCNKALDLVPEFVPAFSTRALAYNTYALYNNLDNQKRHEVFTFAYNDRLTCAKLEPSNADHLSSICVELRNLGSFSDDLNLSKKAVAVANEILLADKLSRRARALALMARAAATSDLGNRNRLETDLNEVCKIFPDDPAFLETRSQFFRLAKIGDSGVQDLARSKIFKTAAMKIEEVYPGGPADKAGLKAGDLIVEIGKERTRSFEGLQQILYDCTGNERIVIISAITKKKEFKSIMPVDGKIGATVTQSVIP